MYYDQPSRLIPTTYFHFSLISLVHLIPCMRSQILIPIISIYLPFFAQNIKEHCHLKIKSFVTEFAISFLIVMLGFLWLLDWQLFMHFVLIYPEVINLRLIFVWLVLTPQMTRAWKILCNKLFFNLLKISHRKFRCFIYPVK